MTASTLRCFVTALTFGFISTAVACGQAPQVFQAPQAPQNSSWGEGVVRNIAAKDKVYVVTIAHPKYRHVCVVAWIDDDKIACTHPGHESVYRVEDVAALVQPGEHAHVWPYFVGFLASAVAATWGTIVLAPVCPPCAVATGAAALILYWMAPASGMMSDDDSPDTLLYLAAGQRLQVKLN